MDFYRLYSSLPTLFGSLTIWRAKWIYIDNQVDAAYIDFRKAFDLGDNDILLKILYLIGFATVI